jgi:hypothetical protein
MPTHFPFGTKWLHCLIALPQSAPEMHHCQYGVAANGVLLICVVPNVCLPVDVGPTGSTACGIQYLI